MRNCLKFQLIPLLPYVTKLHHLCMIWQVTSLPNLIEFILFSASPGDDNEFHIKLQCKLWPWLMAILKFWSTPKLLLRPSWSYGSWIYNHICNQCLSPQTFESRSGEVYSIQHYILIDWVWGLCTFIVPKVPTIFRGNAEDNSWYRGDNESVITRIASLQVFYCTEQLCNSKF
jgi:hypothetical protein